MSSRGPSGRILSRVLRTKTLVADLHAQGCRSQHALATARLAQSAERKTLNLVVVGSSPTVGVLPTFARCEQRAPHGDRTHDHTLTKRMRNLPRNGRVAM